MQFKQDSKVVTSGGDEVGHLDRVVIDPRTAKVTHIVVRKGILFTEDKVVPVDLIASADQNQVLLRPETGDLENLPDFEERHYIAIETEPGEPDYTWGYAPPFYWYPPYGGPSVGYPSYYMPGYVTETEENIPDHTVALKEGADVIGSDGEKVGNVSRLMTDPDSDRITHFVVSKGLLLKEEKLVPVSWVSEVDEDQVHLAVESELLERVPAYEES